MLPFGSDQKRCKKVMENQMNKKLVWAMSTAIALALMVVGVAAASGILTNGDFETGDLTGWSTFTTPNGVSSGGINVVHFQTTTAVVSPSLSAQMRVGQVSFTPGIRAGAGIAQSVTLPGSGVINVSADVAAQELTFVFTNGDGGIFELMVDGAVVASFDSGVIGPGAIERSHLSAELTLDAGTHDVRIQVRRGFLPGSVAQYIDNVDMTVLTVTKSDILGDSGVPGNGVGTAPGLDKEFNEKSNAGEKAGKKP